MAATWILAGPKFAHFSDLDSMEALQGFHIHTNLAGSFTGKGLSLAHSDSMEFGFSGYGFYAWDENGLVMFPGGTRSRLEFGRPGELKRQLEMALREWQEYGKPTLRDFHLVFSGKDGFRDGKWSTRTRSGFLSGSAGTKK
jgi:hypothetical protein